MPSATSTTVAADPASPNAGEAVTQALICLDCREIKMFGPKCELHCDLSNEAAAGLTPLLSPYQKNRPTTKATE